MEGRVKTRQPGAVPKTLGRQVGVIPISRSSKPRRTNSDKKLSIPVGGTDIAIPQDTFEARPPSGSSSLASTRRKSSRSTLGKDDSSPSSISSHKSGQLKSMSGSQLNDSQTSPSTGRTRLSPSSSRSTGSRTQGSRLPSGMSRQSPSAASTKRNSPASKHPTPRSVRADEFDHADEEDNGEQDIRFIDVPSRPGSKVRSDSSSKVRSGSASQKQIDMGRKPHKTIDLEEILAQNMEQDVLKIYDINLHANEITDIDNMEKFRKVKVLDLSCNYIEQIQNLEHNKDLKELKLYDNRIRKIEGLDSLKDLSSLQLQHNKIKSIGKGLMNLKKLKNLRIDCNQLLRIETPELSQCVQLTVIDISYNMLDSLTALNYLPNLEEVNASGNRLRSVSDLSKCKRLQEIDLSRNRLTDLSGLRGLPKLLTLNLSNNQLSSFKSIGRLRSMQDLFASSNHIHDLSTVATQLPALEVLDLTNNEITEWDQFYNLEELGQLVELFISGNPFCAQDGEMPHYYSAIQAVLPDLQIIDGAHIKKQVSKGVPLMRPMTASTIVSLRQMDSQMRNADDQMNTLEKSLEEKFASLRATCETLPALPPGPLFPGESLTTPSSSRCGSRSRILQARQFAASSNMQ